MGDYTHLSMRERCLISTFLEMNIKISEIADRIGRHRSTIYRELARNEKGERYMPGIADALAKERHPTPPNKLDKNTGLNDYVIMIEDKQEFSKKIFQVRICDRGFHDSKDTIVSVSR